MRFRHTMIRVEDLDAAIDFWVGTLGLVETRRDDYPEGKFTLVFLAAPMDEQTALDTRAPELELTYNWEGGEQPRVEGRAWGHLAYNVENIYEFCQGLVDKGLTINRPPCDGKMAFIKSPEGISIEIIQEGQALPAQEPWASMENIGTW